MPFRLFVYLGLAVVLGFVYGDSTVEGTILWYFVVHPVGYAFKQHQGICVAEFARNF
ncbi:hypothetical protein DSUL_20468 [Desulfovibrionales bacterium]